MKLQILIPQYKETDEIVKPLLDSIAIQQNVDFSEIGVIICNDGSDIFLSDEFLKSYPFEIGYYKCPHRGVSATRNACLDHSDAKFVMFCDADDMFCNVFGIWIILKEADKGFDVLTSVFVEEGRSPDTKEIFYINREHDSTFVHGKIFRHQYLIENNIRWNDNLTIHEDSYFNILTQNLTKNFYYCNMPFYLWRWRDESVCRHDPKYILKTYRNLIDSNDALVTEFLNREMKDQATSSVVQMIFDAYYTMNKPEWINQENKEYRDKTEKHFAEWFKKYEKLWKSAPDQQKMEFSMGIRNRSVMEGMQMEKVTIDGWLKKIRKLGKSS